MAQEPLTGRRAAERSVGRVRGREVFEHVASFENLWRAARLAARGKRDVPRVAEFLFDLERNVLRLEEELRAGSWTPGGYRTFTIREPVERLICAAPFADRVVHQALVQVLEPVFEPSFVSHSYACRKGKGTHAALERVFSWARHYPWFLKLDVEKYFPSIDHGIVLGLVARKIECGRTLEVLARILASWTTVGLPPRWFAGDGLLTPAERPRGLPIGNQTSQFLANVMLDPVDHAVKDGLGIRAYARYCDDLVLLGPDRGVLREARARIEERLRGLRLRAHPRKTDMHPTSQGIPWVGFRVFPGRITLAKHGLPRVRRRFRRFGRRGAAAVEPSVRAWCAHAAHARPDRLSAEVASLARSRVPGARAAAAVGHSSVGTSPA